MRGAGQLASMQFQSLAQTGGEGFGVDLHELVTEGRIIGGFAPIAVIRYAWATSPVPFVACRWGTARADGSPRASCVQPSAP